MWDTPDNMQGGRCLYVQCMSSTSMKVATEEIEVRGVHDPMMKGLFWCGPMGGCTTIVNLDIITALRTFNYTTSWSRPDDDTLKTDAIINKCNETTSMVAGPLA